MIGYDDLKTINNQERDLINELLNKINDLTSSKNSSSNSYSSTTNSDRNSLVVRRKNIKDDTKNTKTPENKSNKKIAEFYV